MYKMISSESLAQTTIFKAFPFRKAFMYYLQETKLLIYFKFLLSDIFCYED